MAVEADGICHTPVLLEETLTMLAPQRAESFMIDGTLGEGGHSEAFLSRFADLQICGIDADAAILETAKRRLGHFGDRISFFNGWSEDFFENSDTEKKPDIILMDLGVSLFHYEKGGRGFSFLKDEAFDMRIDTASGVSAAELIANLKEQDLANLLYDNAGERYSRRIAKSIVEERKVARITSSKVLADIVWSAYPPQQRHARTHPATKTFQALRIAVNGELSKLDARLSAAFKVLASGGKLGVITFHSLEDRIVKNFFKKLKQEGPVDVNAPIYTQGGCQILTKKPLACSEEEARRNPPSRSAKLRVVQKIGTAL
ncbi:MAG: 16S rRNA (cytosine(1402)-N(4))-methyltransferase RsmH [Termitinemataceae bacterium]|nr:MAG: 16S rRNA (cytosine(1402)-N(4))-methyltransferase RsmH [Termitinemataceae bacterium]